MWFVCTPNRKAVAPLVLPVVLPELVPDVEAEELVAALFELLFAAPALEVADEEPGAPLVLVPEPEPEPLLVASVPVVDDELVAPLELVLEALLPSAVVPPVPEAALALPLLAPGLVVAPGPDVELAAPALEPGVAAPEQPMRLSPAARTISVGPHRNKSMIPLLYSPRGSRTAQGQMSARRRRRQPPHRPAGSRTPGPFNRDHLPARQ